MHDWCNLRYFFSEPLWCYLLILCLFSLIKSFLRLAGLDSWCFVQSLPSRSGSFHGQSCCSRTGWRRWFWGSSAKIATLMHPGTLSARRWCPSRANTSAALWSLSAGRVWKNLRLLTTLLPPALLQNFLVDGVFTLYILYLCRWSRFYRPQSFNWLARWL